MREAPGRRGKEPGRVREAPRRLGQEPVRVRKAPGSLRKAARGTQARIDDGKKKKARSGRPDQSFCNPASQPGPYVR